MNLHASPEPSSAVRRSEEWHAWSALLGAGMYAFSPLIWLYSTHAEVNAKRCSLCGSKMVSVAAIGVCLTGVLLEQPGGGRAAVSTAEIRSQAECHPCICRVVMVWASPLQPAHGRLLCIAGGPMGSLDWQVPFLCRYSVSRHAVHTSLRWNLTVAGAFFSRSDRLSGCLSAFSPGSCRTSTLCGLRTMRLPARGETRRPGTDFGSISYEVNTAPSDCTLATMARRISSCWHCRTTRTIWLWSRDCTSQLFPPPSASSDIGTTGRSRRSSVITHRFGRTPCCPLSVPHTLTRLGCPCLVRTAILFTFYIVVFHILANLPLNKALFFGIHKRFWMQVRSGPARLWSHSAHLVHCSARTCPDRPLPQLRGRTYCTASLLRWREFDNMSLPARIRSPT